MLSAVYMDINKRGYKKHSNFKGGLIKQKNKQAWQKHENKALQSLFAF